MKKTLLTIFCVLGAFVPVLAQDKITLTDVINIRYAAASRLGAMPKLLNAITSKQTEDGFRRENIINSFQAGNKMQIFYDKLFYISDDLDPQSSLNNTKDVNIEDYLNNLDVQYPKTDDETITFSNLTLSHVKRNDKYTYILIKFDSKFDQPPYTLKKREALLKVERREEKWIAFIANISFYDPAHPIESTDFDVPVSRDTSATSGVLSQGELNKQIDSTENARDSENKSIDNQYNIYVTNGNNELADKHYADAIDDYEKALDLKPLEISLSNKVRDTKRTMEHNTYDYLKNKADELKAERKYAEAFDFYKRAQQQKPDGNLNDTEIKTLRDVLLVVNPPKSILDSKQYQQAIDDCKKKMKEHKKNLNDFPELYFITGKAYEGLYRNNPENPGSKNGAPKNDNLKEAKKNYELAILAFPNYIDALIAEAHFYVRYLDNYPKAISDYELVIQDATDDNPEKPGYYVTEARWKDAQQNYSEELDYYSKAIGLNRKTDSLYFIKGELLYRLKRNDEAKANFDIAIRLNPKYSAAYYYRGLNFYAINDIHRAGIDFTKLTTLSISPAQSRVVDSLSNIFFVQAESLYDKHNYSGADSAYINALELKKCNANALHGQAKIYFAQAQEFASLGKPDDSRRKFENSILLNQQAEACNPSFSDAYFKEGLTHYKIAEYDKAIKCYSDAIRTDPNNIEAYIERGNTFQTQNNFAKAIESYDVAIGILQSSLEAARKGNDRNVVNSLNLKLSQLNQLAGKSQYCREDYGDAVIYLDKSLAYDERNAEAFYYHGLANEGQNDLSKAIKNYNDAIKISKDYRFYYANGTAYFKNKNYDQAIENFNDAIYSDTSATMINRYYLRGLCFFKNKMYDKAFGDYSEYAKTNAAKTDSHFYADYGYDALYLKRDTLASKYFNTALAVDANNYKARFGVGCIYANGGQFDKALENIEKAFATKEMKKDDIKLYEEAFLDKLKNNKPSRATYNQLKKTYLNN